GVTWSSPRFTVNTDTTATDNLTGLIWTSDAGAPTLCSDGSTTISTTCPTGTTIACVGGETTWQGALNYVACLNTNNYLGHNDWRLPNIIELRSLTDYSQPTTGGPSLQSGNPFSNVQTIFYWSSTSVAYYTPNAWVVVMVDGYVGSADKAYSGYVWPVRGGQSGTSGNFVLSVALAGTGSGTVTSGPSGINCGSTCSAS